MKLYSPVISGSLTVTGSTTFIGNITMSGSLSATASNASLLDGTGSVGFTTTGSFTTMSGSVSTRVSQIESVYATTGSNSFRATQSITGSLTVTGQIIAQTLNVQQVTSSIVFSSGSNTFGCDLNSRQTFTGSVIMTGSLVVNTTGTELQVTNNGVILGNLLTDRHGVTGSLFITGGIALRGAFDIFGPSPAMLVSSSGAGAILELRNTVACAYLGIDNLGAYIIPTARGTTLYDGSGTQYLYVTSSGIGIGTTTPNSLLNIVGNSATNGLTIKSAGNGGIFPFRVTWSGGSDGDFFNIDDDGRARFGNPPAPTSGGFTNTRVVIKQSADGVAGGGIQIEQRCSDSVAFFGFTSDTFRIGTSYRFTGTYQPIQILTGGSVRMHIDNSGFVGIGTTCPTKRLQVDAAVANEVAQFNNTRNNGSNDYAIVTTLGSADNNTSNYHYIAATGGADKYYLFGNGTYQTVSDCRLKKNISTVTDTYLDKINALRIVNYNWNEQEDGSALELGMIAQEVEQKIPSIVHEGREHEDGNVYKGIQISSLPYITIKALQEQHCIICSQATMINTLKTCIGIA